MIRHMLDTSVASHVIRGDDSVIRQRLQALPMEAVVISAVTKGEMIYGLARRGWPQALGERVRQFLLRVDVLPWDDGVAQVYGDFRAACEARGVTLSSLDMMIAAHALAAGATLVTRDRAMLRLPPPLVTEAWQA